MSIVFGDYVSDSQLELDLRKKELLLQRDPGTSTRGWIEFNGEVLVNQVFNEMRFIRIRFKDEPAIERVTFFPSMSYGSGGRPRVEFSYGMICETLAE